MGRGSSRAGWGRAWDSGPLPRPEPVPPASEALRLEELLNRLAAAFSFFLFCYTENRKDGWVWVGAWGAIEGFEKTKRGRFKWEKKEKT